MNRLLPTSYFFGALVLTGLLHFALPLRRLLAFPWRLTGLLPLGAGIALNLLADRAFKNHHTTVKPFEASRSLVTRGVFRISRNPMYLGMTLAVFGIALLLGTATPLLVTVVLAVILDRVFIAPEERMLQSTFGEEFRQYRRQVRRWF